MSVQMAAPWQNDMDWQRQYLFYMAAVCGGYLFREAPWEEDAHHNTDLVLTVPSGLRVACRVRRSTYLTNSAYADEFTIRCERRSGIETELSKVLNGWGDYNLYGFADPDVPRRLRAWVLGDLNVFRGWFGAYVDQHGREPGHVIPNGDESSSFAAYRIDDLPSEFVIARQFADGRRVSAA